MNPITARFHWTSPDRTESRETVMRSKFGSKNPAALLQFLLTMAILLGMDHLRIDLLWITVSVLMLLTIIGFAKFLKPFDKRPHAYQVVEWSITPEEIRCSCQNQKIQTTWSAFNKVIATSEGILFLPSAEVFRFIPERAFKTDDDFEALKTLARKYAPDFNELK